MTARVVQMLLVASLLALGACTGDSGPSQRVANRPEVLLIARPEGLMSTGWQTTDGTIRVQDGCILVRGQLVVFPHGTRLVDNASSLRVSPDAPAISLDGQTQVEVMGDPFRFGKFGDPTTDLDEDDLARWTECQRRLDPSPYVDWWFAVSVRIAS